MFKPTPHLSILFTVMWSLAFNKYVYVQVCAYTYRNLLVIQCFKQLKVYKQRFRVSYRKNQHGNEIYINNIFYLFDVKRKTVRLSSITLELYLNRLYLSYYVKWPY